MNATLTGKHWMYEWLDEWQIVDQASFDARIKQKQVKNRLYQLIGQQGSFDPSIVPLSGAVVAGLGLDFGSNATCVRAECRAQIADWEYPQVLPYFDFVVMEGPSATMYSKHLVASSRQEDVDDFFKRIELDVQIMLYIRKIGLSDCIVFSKRADCFCEEHYQTHIRDLGIEDLVRSESLLAIAKDLSKAGSVIVEEAGPRMWFGALTQPQFAGAVGTRIRRKTRPKKYEFVLEIMLRQLNEMVFDMSTSRLLDSPLASLGTSDFFAERRPDGPLSVEDIALRVKVPAFEGLSTRDFLKLRDHEYEHLVRFRSLLTEAIEETIHEARPESPSVAAEAVWINKIRPQVADLERRMRASNRALTRKLVAGAAITGVSAAIGSAVSAVTSSVGGTIGAVVGAAAGVTAMLPGALPTISKTIEERQGYETSDVYFLWRAARASGHA